MFFIYLETMLKLEIHENFYRNLKNSIRLHVRKKNLFCILEKRVVKIEVFFSETFYEIFATGMVECLY